MDLIFSEGLALLLAALRSATPVLAVLLGETLTQRVGVINLGVEGQMLVGAVSGFAAAVVTGDPWLGLLLGACAGMLLSVVHGILVLVCNANQIASGIAIMILGSGLSAFYGIPFVGERIESLGTFGDTWLGQLPLIGPVFNQITPSVLIVLLLVPVVAIFLYKTRPGLVWRSVGESAEVTRNLGMRAKPYQWAGILAGGLFSGFAGAALSVDYTANWVEGMTAGRGLVAVGLVIVARWNPWLALPAALLFGGSEALNLRLQAWGVGVSPYILATLPYLVPLLVLMLTYRQLRETGGGMPQGLKVVFKG